MEKQLREVFEQVEKLEYLGKTPEEIVDFLFENFFDGSNLSEIAHLPHKLLKC